MEQYLLKIEPPTSGQQGEFIVAHFLQQHQYTIIARNYSAKTGEIDIIASPQLEEQSTYVFIEVKYRKSSSFGGAVAAVTPHKCQKIRDTAHIWTQNYDPQQLNYYRFDVVTLQPNEQGLELLWFKEAF